MVGETSVVDGLRSPLPLLGAGLLAGAYAWYAAGARPFTGGALVVVGVAAGAAVLAGLSGRRGPDPAAGDVGRAVPWAILGALLAGWELAAYLQHPRADHPTLSSLAGDVLDWRPAKALALLAWMAVGASLARR